MRDALVARLVMAVNRRELARRLAEEKPSPHAAAFLEDVENTVQALQADLAKLDGDRLEFDKKPEVIQKGETERAAAKAWLATQEPYIPREKDGREKQMVQTKG